MISYRSQSICDINSICWPLKLATRILHLVEFSVGLPQLFTIANAYFSLFISLEQQMKCRNREKLKNVKPKTKKTKKKNRNQNEIQPEANVNKVQSDVCFCQKRKRGESKNTEYFDLCSSVPLSLCLMSLATPCPTHSRVLSVACPA